MYESEYKNHTKNKQVQKILAESSYKEIEASKREVPMSMEDLTAEERKEAQLITEEMAYTLVYRLVRLLSKEEQFIIRHTFGLPKQYTKHTYYETMNRKQMSEILGIPPIEIKRIREEAVKALFRGLIGDRID